jgi:hypothetical protein
MEGGCHSVRAVSHDKRKRLSDISSNYRASANYSPFFTPRTIADRPIGSFPSETGKNLGVRRRYPPVLNDARYTGPVAH